MLKTMETKNLPAFTEIWAILKETAQGLKELKARQEQSQKQQKQSLLVWEAKFQKQQKQSLLVWEAKFQKQQEQSQAGFERLEKIQERAALAVEKSLKEVHQLQKKTDRQIQKVGGRFNERWGRFVESLIEGKLVRLLQARNVKVTESFSNVEIYNEDGSKCLYEFDIVAINGTEVVLTEVKTVLTIGAVKKFINETLPAFRTHSQRHKGRKLYGAVAYLKAEGKAVGFAEEQGLFVIKAVGDSAHLVNKANFKPKVFA